MEQISEERIIELICLHGKTMADNCVGNEELERVFADTVIALGELREARAGQVKGEK
jgi:hypothetical protein